MTRSVVTVDRITSYKEIAGLLTEVPDQRAARADPWSARGRGRLGGGLAGGPGQATGPAPSQNRAAHDRRPRMSPRPHRDLMTSSEAIPTGTPSTWRCWTRPPA